MPTECPFKVKSRCPVFDNENRCVDVVKCPFYHNWSLKRNYGECFSEVNQLKVKARDEAILQAVCEGRQDDGSEVLSEYTARLVDVAVERVLDERKAMLHIADSISRMVESASRPKEKVYVAGPCNEGTRGGRPQICNGFIMLMEVDHIHRDAQFNLFDMEKSIFDAVGPNARD